MGTRLRRWALAAGLVLLYARVLLPRLANWGATREEAHADLPGDEVVPEPEIQTTRAISIGASTSAVWQWIVQMGPRPRAGVYTYDWIERLLGIDIENSDRILPEFQHMDVGEAFALNGKTQLVARRVEPGRCLVLQWQPGDTTWAFVLQPDGPG